MPNILNLRQINTVIKDGKVVDRSYDRNYKAWMFHNSMDDDFGPNISDSDWVEALKDVAWNPNANATRGERGIPGRIPDFNVSPTPAIEKINVHTIMQGSQAVPVVVTRVQLHHPFAALRGPAHLGDAGNRYASADPGGQPHGDTFHHPGEPVRGAGQGASGGAQPAAAADAALGRQLQPGAYPGAAPGDPDGVLPGAVLSPKR